MGRLGEYPVAAAEQREAAFGGEAVVKSDSAVIQVDRVRWVYDGFAAERCLALLDSCYIGGYFNAGSPMFIFFHPCNNTWAFGSCPFSR